MDIRDLEYVTCVQQHGSIGKAAELLDISQPALSKAVRRVEEQIGQRLFERIPQGIRTTPAGELFLDRALKLRRDYDDAMAEMNGLRTGEQGVVRIGYSLTFSPSLLHQTCKRLLRERPAAKLRLSSHMAHELLGALRAGELDIVCAPIRNGSSEFDIQPLYRDRLVIAADAEHPLCKARKLRLEDLAGEEWALPAGHITVRRMLDNAFRQRNLPLLPRVEVDVGSTKAYQLIVGTRLLTFAHYGQEFFTTGLGVIDLQPGELELDRRVHLVTRTGGYLSPVCQRALELFREEVAKGIFGLETD
ncbi:MAG: Hydrogen peroxide-inducible genes activator [Pseudomonas citronellolis]|nr:MAG: Hydrogen peroxide-inducible genes activator [Pseudomonas citronellolis]